MTFTKQLLAIGMLICMTCATAFGQTTLYWTGNTDTTWNNAGNWSTTPGGSSASVPTSADIAVFTASAANPCILDVNASVAELLIDVTANKDLDLNGYDLTVAGDFTQYTAIFDGDNGTVTIGGLLHIIGGDFRATTGTTSVADGIVEEGLYFHPNGGKVRITGTGATIDVASFFYDLEIASGASAELANNIEVANSLELNGPLDADVNGIVIGNSSTTAITGTNGVYFNIGAGPIGLFIWLIGENTGTYTLPFLATTSGPVIPVEVDITTAGDGPDGAMLFSCIELDYTKPQELLGDGIGYYNATGGNNADYNANRIWVMIASDYTESPVFDLELSYTTADLSGISVTEANLKMQAYDELHWGELLGTVNTTANTLAVTGYTLPTDDRTSFITLVDNTSPNKSTYGGKTGLTCADAIELDSIDAETVFEMEDTVMWFLITPINDIVDLSFENYGTDSFNVKELQVYHPECDSAFKLAYVQLNEYQVYDNISITCIIGLEEGQYLVKSVQPLGKTTKMRKKSNSFDVVSCDTETISGQSIPIDYFKQSLDCVDEVYIAPGSAGWDTMPVKKLRLNFHFLQLNTATDPNTTNFNADNSAIAGAYYNISGYDMADSIVKELNRMLGINQDITYKPISSIPAHRTRLEAEIYTNPDDSTDRGVYFHVVDSNFYFLNRYADVFNDSTGNTLTNLYSVNRGKAIDIWMFAHYDDLPDTSKNKSTTSNGSSSSFNLGFGSSVIINNTWQILKNNPNRPEGLFNPGGLLYHELGHSMGLDHTFTGLPSCVTTPELCFYFDSTRCFPFDPPQCTDMAYVDECGTNIGICINNGIVQNDTAGNILWKQSCGYNNYANNVMGYHGGQKFISPCQLDIAHRFMDDMHPSEVFEECIKDPYATITIDTSAPVVWDTPKWPSGDVIIYPENELIIRCKVKMTPGSKIIVSRGAKLTVEGGLITSCIGNTWDGIEVWGVSTTTQPSLSAVMNGSYPSSSTDHGVVIIKDSSIIEYAVTGVQLSKVQSWGHDLTYTGGIVIAQNSLFRNNRNSIGFMKYPENFYRSNSAFKSVSSITNCRFENDHRILAGANPYAFITLWNVHGVQIRDNYFLNKQPEAFGAGRKGDGIVAIDAEFTASDNKFENLNNAVNISATGWNPDQFIIFDSIINCEVAIMATSNILPKIYKNVIVVDTNAPYPLQYWARGIYNMGNLIPKIEGNEIYFPDTDIGRSYGIYSVATGPLASQVYRNNITGGNNLFALPNSFNNAGLQLKCNNVLSEMDHIVVLSGEIAEMQGNCNLPDAAGNKFYTANCGAQDNTHLYLYLNGPSFEYDYYSTVAQTPDTANCTYGRIIAQSCPQPFNPDFCKLKIDTTGSSGLGKGDDIFSDNDTAIMAKKAALAQLDNNRTDSLIIKIKNPSISDNTIYDSILSANGMTSDGAFLALMYERPSFDKDKLAYLLKLNSPHSNVIWKEVKRIANEFDSDSLTLLEQYQDSASARKPIVDEVYSYSHKIAINYGELFYWQGLDTTLTIERIIDSLETETDVQLQLLLADYYVADSMLTEAEDIYENLSVYNQDLLKLVQLKKHTLTFAQNGWTWFDLVGEGSATAYMDSIAAIAGSDSSIAAFQAQVILELVGADTVVRVYEEKQGSSKWDETNTIERPKSKEDNVSTFRIYPNPAQNELVLEYKLKTENNPNTVFTIFNIMGAKQYEVKLTNSTTNIDVSPLVNGMYLFVITENSEVVQNGKISIIK